MDVSWPVLFLLLLFVWMLCVRVYEAIRKFPPSCIGLPVVGRIPMILKRTLLTPGTNFFRELSRDGVSKGDVWCTFLGMRRVVCLTSYDAVFDALSSNDFTRRPTLSAFTASRRIGEDESEVGGLIFCNGELWREHRKFLMSIMHNLIAGKNSLEKKVQLEAKYLNEEIKKFVSQFANPRPFLSKSTSNVVSQFLFGYRTDPDDMEFGEFNKSLRTRIIKGRSGTAFLPVLFPFLEGSFILKLLGKKDLDKDKEMIAFIADKMSKVEDEMVSDGDDEPQNYVEAFLQKQRSDDEKSSFTRKQLIISLYDVFMGGVETTASFLNWALLYLSVYREWQTALQAEIDENLRSLEQISYDDRARYNKTMAFIDEVQRRASVTPHNVFHAAGEECFFRGYRIPTDALIIGDIYMVHNDPRLWKDPARFDPSRFLNESGEYQASKYVIPNSVGNRVCPGQGLVRMQAFIFLTTILSAFEVDVDDAAKSLKDDVFIGTRKNFHMPLDHKVIFTARSA